MTGCAVPFFSSIKCAAAIGFAGAFAEDHELDPAEIAICVYEQYPDCIEGSEG